MTLFNFACFDLLGNRRLQIAVCSAQFVHKPNLQKCQALNEKFHTSCCQKSSDKKANSFFRFLLFISEDLKNWENIIAAVPTMKSQMHE